ncbi:ECF transporter S component [Neomoorella glycerini]|uniref:ECF transporter S component n=1 Tax=Neomoorella glycerini TaxID=55779 RepID=UPI001FE868AC|nr:ECF transporter S component [Moorella glycerini]
MVYGRKILFPLAWLAILALLLASIKLKVLLLGQGWGLLASAIIILALLLLYWGFEQGRVSSREVAVVAMLGTLAAVGRVPFAALPSIQPVTFLVINSGFVFGPGAGFMVGSTAALVSNFFLGQGPWTPWQMFAWGLAGSSAGVVKILFPRAGKKFMTVFSFLWGYFFGWIMNLWFWTAFVHPLNWQSFAAAYAASFWFDTFHALGNAAFYLLFGPGFVKILERFRRKLEVTLLPLVEGEEDANL